jgi:hypothetical protein
MLVDISINAISTRSHPNAPYAHLSGTGAASSRRHLVCQWNDADEWIDIGRVGQGARRKRGIAAELYCRIIQRNAEILGNLSWKRSVPCDYSLRWIIHVQVQYPVQSKPQHGHPTLHKLKWRRHFHLQAARIRCIRRNIQLNKHLRPLQFFRQGLRKEIHQFRLVFRVGAIREIREQAVRGCYRWS